MNIKEPIGKIPTVEIPMNSAALQWNGQTHGPIQDALVREHKSKLDLVK